MKIKIKTRFGKVIEFEKKDRGPFRQLPGERFITALVRHYYPKDYRRIYGKVGA